MRRLLQSVRRLMLSDDGPTAVEYAVMLSLIVIVCLEAIKAVGTNAKATFTNVGNSIGCNSHPACDSTLKNNDLRRMLAFALSVHV